MKRAALTLTLIAALFVWLAPRSVYAQPGCNGTPVPTPGDTGDIFIQGPCPSQTPTPTPPAPTRGASTPEPGNSGPGDEFNYRPSPEAQDYPVPDFPILSSPSAVASWTPIADGNGQSEEQNNLATAGADGLAQADGGLSTIEALQTATLSGFNLPDGTELDFEVQTQTIEQDMINLFSYIKGLDPTFWGRASILITVVIIQLVWFTSFRATLLSIPVIVAIFNMIRKLYNMIVRAIGALPG